MNEILHNPNCLLSPTGRHIYECGYEYEVCKFCNEAHRDLVSYIDEDEQRNKYLFGGQRTKSKSMLGGFITGRQRRGERV